MPPVQLVPVVPVCTEGLCPGSLGWGSPSHKMVDHLPTASTIHCFRVVGFTQPQNGRSMGGTIYIYIYTFIPVCFFLCIHTYHVYMYTHPYVLIYRMSISTQTHIYVHIYIYIYTCICMCYYHAFTVGLCLFIAGNRKLTWNIIYIEIHTHASKQMLLNVLCVLLCKCSF